MLRRFALGLIPALVLVLWAPSAPVAMATVPREPATSTYTPPAGVDISGMGWAAAFDALIEKMSAEYAFTEWKDIDWANLARTFRPAIVSAEAAGDTAAYYLALRAMLNELHDGHVRITDDEAILRSLAGGGFGFVLSRLADGTVAVTWLDPQGPGARAGMRLGTRVVAVDGVAVERALRRTSTVLAPNQPTAARVDYERLRFIARAPVGGQRSFTFRGPGSRARSTARLVAADDSLATWHLTDSRSLLNKPPFPSSFVSARMLPGKIGYIRVLAELDMPESFVGDHTPTLTQFRHAVASLSSRGATGLILDIRGNAGGSDQMVADMLGSFVPGPSFYEYQNYIDPTTGKFGIWMVDESTGDYVTPGAGITIRPSAPRFTKPVVALIDNACISSCEGIAMGVARLPQGRVVGIYGTNGSFGMSGDGAVMPGGYTVFWPYGQSLDKERIVQIDTRHLRGGILPTDPVPLTLTTAVRTLAGADVVLDGGVRVLRALTEAAGSTR